MSLLRRCNAAPWLLLAALAWMGCEASPYPLADTPSIPVDESLLGTWDLETPEGDVGDRMIVSKAGDFEYDVLYMDGDADEAGSVVYSDTSAVRVFFSDLDGRLFANIHGVDGDGDDDEWLFMAVDRLESTRVLLSPVQDAFYETVKEAPDIDAVVRALRAFLEGDDPFGESATFRKVL